MGWTLPLGSATGHVFSPDRSDAKFLDEPLALKLATKVAHTLREVLDIDPQLGAFEVLAQAYACCP